MSLDSRIFLEPHKLRNFAQLYRKSYSQAKPFPHIVIDNLFPEEIVEKVLDEFPKPEEIKWEKFDRPTERKLVTTSENQMGKITRLFFYQLNSSNFIYFLEALTGIEGIIPDPHFRAGGLHQIERGGYFKIHADFNRYPKLGLDRRLVLLLYLNKDWKEEYEGHLELWNRDATECVQRILPVFNRCVIFNTTDFSYHGHPAPLKCPDGETRKSLLVYYYTNGRPSEEVSPEHSTLFQGRPRVIVNSKFILKKLTPPIFIDIRNYLQPEPLRRLKRH